VLLCLTYHSHVEHPPPLPPTLHPPTHPHPPPSPPGCHHCSRGCSAYNYPQSTLKKRSFTVINGRPPLRRLRVASSHTHTHARPGISAASITNYDHRRVFRLRTRDGGGGGGGGVGVPVCRPRLQAPHVVPFVVRERRRKH